MNTLNENALEFIKSELIKAQIDIFQSKSGREGVDFIVENNTGNQHEIYLQPINLNKERSYQNKI